MNRTRSGVRALSILLLICAPGTGRAFWPTRAASPAATSSPAAAVAPTSSPAAAVAATSSPAASSLADTLALWATQRLGRRLTMKSAAVTWSGSLVLEDVQLADASGKSAQLTVKHVEADYSVQGLLSGRQDIVQVRLVKPGLNVHVRADRSTDLDDMLKMWKKTAVEPATPLPDYAITDGAIEVALGGGEKWHATGLTAKTKNTAGTIAIDVAGQLNKSAAHVTASMSPDGGLRGSVSVASLDLHSSGVNLPLTGLKSEFAATSKSVALSGLHAGLEGGRLSGAIAMSAGSPTFDLLLEDASLTQLMRVIGVSSQRATGRINIAFKGQGAIPALSGAGRISFPELVVDVSSTDAVAAGRRSLRGGRVAGGALALVLGTNPIGMLVLAGASESNYYTRLLDVLSKPQRMRGVKAKVKASHGQIVLDPISGPDLVGHLTVGQASRSIAGSFSLVRLGAVEIHGLKVSGNASSPTTQVDLKQVTMNGSAAPVAGLGGGVVGKGATAIKDTVESIPRGVGHAIGSLFGGDRTDSQPRKRHGIAGLFH